MTHVTTTHRRIHGPVTLPRRATRAHVLGGVVRASVSSHAVHRRDTVRRRIERSASERLRAAAIFLAVTVTVAGLGAWLVGEGMAWYERAEHPALNPPDAVFGSVLTVLYAINAIAGYLSWRATRRSEPTVLWAAGMALNLGWTVCVFGLRAPTPGLAIIAALGLVTVAYAVSAWRCSRTSTWLMFPYLSWITFATVLDVALATGR